MIVQIVGKRYRDGHHDRFWVAALLVVGTNPQATLGPTPTTPLCVLGAEVKHAIATTDEGFE